MRLVLLPESHWWSPLALPVALILAMLVARNYRLRSIRVLPDEWYWADAILVKLGWAVTTH